MQIENNGHSAIRFQVHLTFVDAQAENGYSRQDVSHATTKEAAIVEVLMKYMEERYPLAGIAVWELAFTC